MRTPSLVAVLAPLTLAGLLAGCPMSSTWTSPRTIPEGTMSHTIGVETIALVDRTEGDVDGDGEITKWFEKQGVDVAPMVFPAYVLRIGLGSRFDIGLKGSTAGSLQADFKFQLIKTPAFDMALDPSIQLSLINTASLPVMFGLNFGEDLSLYLGPRATWILRAQSNLWMENGLAVGGTVGFRISASESLTLYPEVGWLRGLSKDVNGHLVTVGIGFSFGSGQPEYGPGSIEYIEGNP